jgi:hypothetical protein
MMCNLIRVELELDYVISLFNSQEPADCRSTDDCICNHADCVRGLSVVCAVRTQF